MRKNRIIVGLAVLIVSAIGFLPVAAVSEEQRAIIKNHCDVLRDDLKKVQRNDSRTRVRLGGYYESILTKYIKPLNVKLVEGNYSNASLVENQNRFANAKIAFSNDFVIYQKGLEELIAIDCKNEPERFYDKLVSVRKKRKTVEQDTVKIKELISEHVSLINGLLEKM